jgi:mannose-6-phosphate isomerase
MCVKGEVEFIYQNQQEKLQYGETLLVPACIKEFEIHTSSNSELLEVFIQ